MKIRYSLLLIGFGLLPWASGCPKPGENTPASNTPAGETPAETGETEHAHVHEGDDALVWQRDEVEHEGYMLALGHHGIHLYTGHAAEPAVMVSKDGQPVADAKVFVTLLDEPGDKVITEEQATIYEPPTDEEPAHYAQAKVKIPADAKAVTLRYRVEMPGASEFTQDVPVEVTKH